MQAKDIHGGLVVAYTNHLSQDFNVDALCGEVVERAATRGSIEWVIRRLDRETQAPIMEPDTVRVSVHPAARSVDKDVLRDAFALGLTEEAVEEYRRGALEQIGSLRFDNDYANDPNYYYWSMSVPMSEPKERFVTLPSRNIIGPWDAYVVERDAERERRAHRQRAAADRAAVLSKQRAEADAALVALGVGGTAVRTSYGVTVEFTYDEFMQLVKVVAR